MLLCQNFTAENNIQHIFQGLQNFCLLKGLLLYFVIIKMNSVVEFHTKQVEQIKNFCYLS